jgi:hypothetical protein
MGSQKNTKKQNRQKHNADQNKKGPAKNNGQHVPTKIHRPPNGVNENKYTDENVQYDIPKIIIFFGSLVFLVIFCVAKAGYLSDAIIAIPSLIIGLFSLVYGIREQHTVTFCTGISLILLSTDYWV